MAPLWPCVSDPVRWWWRFRLDKQDTVEWGSLFVGCAGGGDSLITLPVEQDVVDPDSFESYR